MVLASRSSHGKEDLGDHGSQMDSNNEGASNPQGRENYPLSLQGMFSPGFSSLATPNFGICPSVYKCKVSWPFSTHKFFKLLGTLLPVSYVHLDPTIRFFVFVLRCVQVHYGAVCHVCTCTWRPEAPYLLLGVTVIP